MFNFKVIKALLFDLGGVVIEIDFDRVFNAWSKYSSLSCKQITDSFYFDVMYQQHERGEIESQVYYNHVRSTFNLTATNEQIELGWNKIFSGEIKSVVKQIDKIKSQINCYAFTNTNAAHQSAWELCCPNVAPLFQRVFSSCNLGYRKPDSAAFNTVLSLMQVDKNEVLFFDDTEENIIAAKDLGIQAQLVKNPSDVLNVLVQFSNF
tara:strand:+ start:741 stop:1361 length:621 start_codon:yes stop_codon:yes gene_type:complete